MPQEDELVLCTVTAVQYNSVFAKLDEYGKTGMIHISEIAPGRIRNIRDYVVEGKKIVCQVLRIDPEKGHIDLSLRRVNEMQKRKKLDSIKQEQLSEKIIEFVANKRKENVEALCNTISEKILEKYPSLFDAFEGVVRGEVDLAKILDKDLAKELTDVIKQRIRLHEIEVGGDIKLISYAPNGVEVVKAALKKAQESKSSPVIKYKGAGTYSITIKSDDYKAAEKALKQAVDEMLKYAKEHKAIAEFTRIEKE
ncbi:MAG: S1 RNA-binding domain-containing protein [Candidatus Woesearchaeota archaeon]